LEYKNQQYNSNKLQFIISHC